MAQTRACAKALRNVLSWVVVLAGYKTTPAEEVEGVETPPSKAATVKSPAAAPPQAQTKKPETATAGPMAVGRVEDILLAKEGEKNGKAWKLWSITVGGVVYGTFSKSVAEEADTAQDRGVDVRIGYKVNERGNNEITSLEMVAQEATGA